MNKRKLKQEYMKAARAEVPAPDSVLLEIKQDIYQATAKRPRVKIGKLLVGLVLGDNDFSINRHPISGFIMRPMDYVARKIQLLKEKRALLSDSKERSNSKRM